MPHPHHPTAIDLAATAAAVALVCVYVLGLRLSRRLGARSQALPAWRSAAFLLGVATIWTAAASPLAACDAGSLTGHMVQHLLLMTLAPLLLLLGEPVRVMPGGMPRRIRNAILRRFPRSISLGAAAACWLAASGTLVLWHVPGVFALAFSSPAWHAIEQASFLLTGLLFWWPVIEPWPTRPLPPWSIVLYLFLATLPCDVLSAFLVFSDRIAYPVYLSAESPAAVLADQQRAGALMWTCVTIVYLVAGTLVSARLLSLRESPDRATELPQARATRAAAPGTRAAARVV